MRTDKTKAAEPDAGGWEALVVEDNLISREIAAGILESFGLKVTEAADGLQALKLAGEKQYDIIFMDRLMPGMDGIETAERIRGERGANGESPVMVAMTADAGEKAGEELYSGDFQDFLSKPLERERIREILLRWLPGWPGADGDDGYGDRDGTGASDGAGGDDFADIRIGGIDMDVARKYHSDAAGYEELLRLFCLDGRRKLELLGRLSDERDLKTYETVVHGLKSEALSIGAAGLSAMAREHEQAASRGEADVIAGEFPHLAATYERQMEAIGRFLDGRRERSPAEREQSPGEGESRAMDRKTPAEEIGEALELLEHFHSRECRRRIDDLLERLPDGETADRLKEIREQLELYEDDAAEEMFRRLLKWLDKEE